MSKPPKSDPFSQLQAALLALPTGKDGFEGLCGELLAQLTDNRIRMMDSGEQSGIDAVEEDSLPLRRALQAKRYKTNTALDYTALNGEMSEAKLNFAGLDCWILATTRNVSGQGLKKLTQQAELLGIGLIVLDWSGSADYPPALAVLCTAYAEITLRYCPGANTDIESIKNAANFNNALQKLCHDIALPSIVFQATATNSAKRLSLVFEDAAAARTLAGPSPSFFSRSAPVERQAVTTAFKQWWETDMPAAVLLGLEGTGKTWVSLLAIRSTSGESPSPIVIFVKSKSATKSRDAIEAVIESLCDLGDRSGIALAEPHEFWRRKIRSWASVVGKREKILVVVDGLDEDQTLGWAEWLAPLFEKAWNGLFRVVLTTRPDWWSHGLGAVRTLLKGSLKEVPVGRFSAPERDAYLVANRINPDDLAPKAREAALHPRTAFHLVRLSDQLPDLKRVTREQLMLLDYQNRWEVKGHQHPRHDHFTALVRKIALQAREAALSQKPSDVTEGEALAAADKIFGSGQGTLGFVLNELIDGRWFQRNKDTPSTLEFVDTALPDAIGMALAAEIRTSGASEIKDRLKTFLEPWGSDDITDKVVRMCAVTLVLDETVSDEACEVVLSFWRDRPLRASGGNDFWRRLHAFRLPLFIRICEQHPARHYDWMCEWGLASCWEDYPALRDQIEQAVTRWCANTPLEPEVKRGEDEFYHHMNRSRIRQLRRLAAINRRGWHGWDSILAGTSDDVHLRSAIRIISLLPRKPFVSAIVAWAMGMAAAGQSRYASKMAWLFRANKLDDEEAAETLRSVATMWLARDEPFYRRVGTLLGELLGWPDDADRVRIRAFKYGSSWRVLRTLIHDGASFGLPAGHRSDDWRQILNELSSHASQVSACIGSDLQDELKQIARNLPAHLERRDTEYALTRTFLPLSRWSDDEFARAVHEVLMDDQRCMGVNVIESCFGIFTDGEANQIAQRFEGDGTKTPEKFETSRLFSLRLAHLDLERQFALLVAPENAELANSELIHLLQPPKGNELGIFIDSFDYGGPMEHLRQKIFIATHALQKRKYSPTYRPIPWDKLLAHSDDRLRELSFQLAWHLEDKSASDYLISKEWKAAQEKQQILQFLGSALLTLQADEILRPLLKGLEAQVLGNLLNQRPGLVADVLPLFGEYLRGEVATERSSIAIGRAGWGYGDQVTRDYHSVYVKYHQAEAAALLQGAWENKKCRINFHADTPTWDLIEALAPKEPELCFKIWSEEMERWGNSFRSQSWENLPFTLPAGGVFDRMRSMVWERADSDADYLSLVTEAMRHGQSSWLLGQIRADLGSTELYKRARGWTAAGFLDEPCGSDLWNQLMPLLPTSGWLCDVAQASSRWYQRNLDARHWMRELGAADTEDKAWCAYNLLRECLDPRYTLWFGRHPFSTNGHPWRTRWMSFDHHTRSNVVKEVRKGLDKTLFHTEMATDWVNY